ncbi:hypothetical protein DERP_007468 [Dermatophagoides pteronyssinus]|uniref:Uncharacterized protein n=1 Tax=Dermatophagoides pteronyssinus TaxID=6956 RepID=A0ABQ8J4K5_DERPT|nr:hypothetical protein DERP_007468 [Dermatophagoides pteronyssinus]
MIILYNGVQVADDKSKLFNNCKNVCSIFGEHNINAIIANNNKQIIHVLRSNKQLIIYNMINII